MTFKVPRTVVFLTLLSTFVLAAFLAVNWQIVSAFVEAFESQLKVLSLLLGPVATIVGFYLGHQAKREFVDINTSQKGDFTKKVNDFKQSAEGHAALLAQKSELLGEARTRAESATKALVEKEAQVALALSEVKREGAAVAKLQRDLHRITEGSQELWKLREPAPFAEYRLWLRDPAAPKVVTFANLKGGVGKTTLAANFAAYASATLGKRVLLIDLDYQGSLSNMMMLAAGQVVTESLVDQILEPSDEDGLARISRVKVHLDKILSRVWLVPASYTLVQRENLLLLKWLLDDQGGVDVRYRLAKVILAPSLHSEFDLIVLDTPPRMTIGTVNALVASHYLVIPTSLDSLSSEAVPQFVTNMNSIKKDLGLDIQLGGIVGMMSRQATLGDNERRALNRARDGGRLWDKDVDYVCETIIPRRVSIGDAAGEDVAYLRTEPRQLFDPLFVEICERIGLT